jgi:hypothetical protein
MPALACGPDGVALAWLSSPVMSDPTSRIWLTRLSDNGVALGPDTEIATPASRVAGLAAAVTADGNEIAVAWIEAPGAVHLARLDRGGALIETIAPAVVTDRAFGPALAATDAGWMLAWADGSTWLMRVDPMGSPAVASVPPERLPVDAAPQLAIFPGSDDASYVAQLVGTITLQITPFVPRVFGEGPLSPFRLTLAIPASNIRLASSPPEVGIAAVGDGTFAFERYTRGGLMPALMGSYPIRPDAPLALTWSGSAYAFVVDVMSAGDTLRAFALDSAGTTLGVTDWVTSSPFPIASIDVCALASTGLGAAWVDTDPAGARVSYVRTTECP